MIKTINDKSSVNDILFYISNPFNIKDNGTRTVGEYEDAQEILLNRYIRGPELLEQLRIFLIENSKGRIDQYNSPIEPVKPIDLLHHIMDNRPDLLVDRLRAFHRRYESRKKKAEKPLESLTWMDQRIAQLCAFTYKYRQRFEKNDKSIIEFDYLSSDDMKLKELEKNLFLQVNRNKKNPCHNLYKRVKSIERAIEKFVKNVKQEKFFNPDPKNFDRGNCDIEDIFGLKDIALDWNFLKIFEDFVYYKAKYNGWISEDKDKKDFRRVEGKDLGFIRYYLTKKDDESGINFKFSLQFTTIVDYLLDEFFSKDSHFRHVREFNRLKKEVEEAMKKKGKSPKKFKEHYLTHEDYIVMKNRLYELYKPLIKIT